MKLKTVLLAGLVSAAGVLSLSAADVFSVNVVGFANTTVPATSFAIIANPLSSSDNSLTNLFASVPGSPGVVVYRFNLTSQGFSTYTKGTRGWSGTGLDLKTADQVIFNPGEAFFVYNPGASPLTLTFVGEVVKESTTTIPSGFSLSSSVVPQSEKLQTTLGLPAANGDVVYFFRNGAYAVASKTARGWSGDGVDASGEPVPAVGEGFFYFNAATQKSWVRSFSAN